MDDSSNHQMEDTPIQTSNEMDTSESDQKPANSVPPTTDATFSSKPPTVSPSTPSSPSQDTQQNKYQSTEFTSDETTKKSDPHQSNDEETPQSSLNSTTSDNNDNKNSEESHCLPSINKSNILEALEDFDSSIPDAVVHHFLNSSGMQTKDPRIIKLIAIAAQKFIHDVVSDSLQHCKLRGTQGKKTKEKKFTLALEDLTAALAEYGIEIRRQQYFN